MPGAEKTLDITLHFGAHKTATTHLQSVLSRNQKALRLAGQKYFGPVQIRQHRGGVQRFLRLDEPKQVRDERLAELSGPHSKVLLSEENFAGRILANQGKRTGRRPYPRADQRFFALAQGLADHRLHLAFAVRNPATFLVSAYSQVLFAGQFDRWDNFVDHIDFEVFRWFPMIAGIANSGLCESITIWPYERYRVDFDKILVALLGEGHPPIDADIQRETHVGLSAAAVEACEKWNAEGYKGHLGVIAREDFPVSDAHPRFQPWSPGQLKIAQSAYLDDLTKIAALPNVNFIGAGLLETLED